MLEALLVLLAAARLSLPSSGDVRWAVKIAARGNSREQTARELADERGLELVGQVDPFPDVFEFRLSQKERQARSAGDGIGQMDSQTVDEAVHASLVGHPAVEWVSKQVGLRRVKREFKDPAFPRQWHLV